MSLLAVEEALARVLASIERPVEPESVPVSACAGRTLAADLVAIHDQPPFAASAMDGYAVRSEDVAQVPASLRLIGTSIAGRAFPGTLAPREAVRIFTGAPVPAGADAVVIQEDTQADGESVVVKERPGEHQFIRPAGLDFRAGASLLRAGQRLDARRLALSAAMGHGALPVRRPPRIAILATGDELVRPGERPGPDQIVASNPYAIAAMVEKAGGEPLDLGLARDLFEELEERIAAAEDARADVLVTLGGASVGEHDLVRSTLARRGMELGFWRVALRPGKPLIHGRLGGMMLLGLPGNPVSSIVCAILFLVPAIRALLGDAAAGLDPSESGLLGADLTANDARQDYLRAALSIERVSADTPAGPQHLFVPTATPYGPQDSSMLSVMARSDALIVRPPLALPARAGEACRFIRVERFC
jgi:molybdopterin molybdotransferase